MPQLLDARTVLQRTIASGGKPLLTKPFERPLIELCGTVADIDRMDTAGHDVVRCTALLIVHTIRSIAGNRVVLTKHIHQRCLRTWFDGSRIWIFCGIVGLYCFELGTRHGVFERLLELQHCWVKGTGVQEYLLPGTGHRGQVPV